MLVHPIQAKERYPIGSIIEAHIAPSSNWILCDGSVLAKADYPVLASIARNQHPNMYQHWEYEANVLCPDGIECMAQNSGDLIVGVGYNGGYAITSNYGVSWTTGSLPTSGDYICIACNGTIFVAFEYNTGKVVTSTDGTTWTQRSLPATAKYMFVVWDGSYFVTLPRGGTQAIWSSDGINWYNTGSVTLTGTRYWEIGATDGSRILVSDKTYSMAYSDDSGANWTALETVTGQHFNSLDYLEDDNLWIASGDSPGFIATSSNGLEWDFNRHFVSKSFGTHLIPHSGVSSYPLDIVKIRKLFTDFYFAVSFSGHYMFYSTDLKIWEPIGATSYEFHDCFYNSSNGYIYVLGYGIDLMKVKKINEYNTSTHFQLPIAYPVIELEKDYTRYKFIRVK